MARTGSITKYFYTKQPNGTGTSGTILATASSASNAVFSLTFNWEVLSQDIVNNASTISWSLRAAEVDLSKVSSSVMGFTSASYLLFGTDDKQQFSPFDDYNDVEITIAGETLYTTTSFCEALLKTGNLEIASGVNTITHGSDGALNASFTAMVRVRNVFDANNLPAYRYNLDEDFGTGSRASVTGTINLDTIPRQAVLLSATDFTDDNPPTITFAIPTGATNVMACISLSSNVNSADIVKPISGSEYTFSFTAADKEKLWSILKQGLDTKQVSFWITSTFNGTYYENGPIIKTLTISGYRPTLSPVVTEANDEVYNNLTGNRNILVRHVSNAYFDSGATAYKGAKIESWLAVNNGTALASKTGTFEKVASPNFYFTATDDAGRNVTADYVIPSANWIPYVKLTCSAEVTEMTADGDVKVTLTGKYFNGSFGKKINRMRLNYDIAENNDDWNHVDKGYIYPTVDSDANYTYTFTISGLNYMSVYELTVRVSDEVAVEGTETNTVIASTPIFDWGRTDFNFNVPVTIQGGDVPTIVAQSLSDSGWSYRKWSDGTAECWRTLSVTAAVSTSTNASWYSSGELTSTNLSFPFTFVARPAVTVQTMPTGSSWCIVFPSNTTGSTTKTGSYQLNSMSSTTSRAHLLSYMVKGRWK